GGIQNESLVPEKCALESGWFFGGLSAEILPPCASMICFATGSPRPAPGARSSPTRSAWKKGSKTFSASSASMPSPWSNTSKQSRRSSEVTRTSTWLPCGLNLIALSITFPSACLSLRSSPQPVAGSGSTESSSVIRRAFAFGFSSSSTDFAAARGSKVSRWIAYPPLSSVAKSTRLSIVLERRSEAVCIESRIFRCGSVRVPVFSDLRIFRYPVIGVRGVASSCERFCMNSVLLRAADPRHLGVAEDQVGVRGDGEIDPGDAVRSLEDVESSRFQDVADEGAALRVVLDVEDARVRRGCLFGHR